MGRWDDATVDLIYLDPPFNSNANYNVLYARDNGLARILGQSGMLAYLTSMAERIEQMHGVRPALHRAVLQARRRGHGKVAISLTTSLGLVARRRGTRIPYQERIFRESPGATS